MMNDINTVVTDKIEKEDLEDDQVMELDEEYDGKKNALGNDNLMSMMEEVKVSCPVL